MGNSSGPAGALPPPRRSHRRFAILLVSGLLVAGCSGRDETAQPASTPTVSTPTTATQAPTSTNATRDATTPLAGPRHVPGSKIEGNFDDHSAALLKRRTAYYAKIVITNESGNPMPLEVPRFDGLTSGGELADSVLIGGDLPDCRSTGPPESFDHKGAQWVTCELWVSSPSRVAPRRAVREQSDRSRSQPAETPATADAWPTNGPDSHR
jgi:hypothetical protein